MLVEFYGPHTLKHCDAPRLRGLTRPDGRMLSTLENPDGAIAIEARDALGRVIGWASAFKRPRRRYPVIDVFVARRHRGRGVGRMLAVAITHAAQRRWHRRYVLISPIDSAGRRMYRSVGF